MREKQLHVREHHDLVVPHARIAETRIVSGAWECTSIIRQLPDGNIIRRVINHLLTTRCNVGPRQDAGLAWPPRHMLADGSDVMTRRASGVGMVMRNKCSRRNGMPEFIGNGLAVAMSLVCAVLATGCSSSSSGQKTTGWQPTSVDRTPPAHPVPLRPVGQPLAAQPAALAPSGAVSKVRGVYKVGKPYEVAGVVYTPAEDPRYDRVGIASWYGLDFHAKQTANGEVFDMNAISAAHPTLPMPSYLYVTNLRNGRTLLVRLNDRGPYKPGRIVDLSRHAAQLLGFEAQGTTEARVRYAGPAPLDPTDTRRERQHLASQPWSRAARTVSDMSWGRRFGLGFGGTAQN